MGECFFWYWITQVVPDEGRKTVVVVVLYTWRGRATTDGKTSPGESHNRTFFVRKIVWKCFVWPGVRDTLTTFKATQNMDRFSLL